MEEKVFHQELPDTGEFSMQLQAATDQVPLIVITNMEQRKQAEELLSALKELRQHPQIKQIEELKKDAYAHWKKLSALLKGFVDPIDKAIAALKAKLLAFDKEERHRRELEAEKLKEEMRRREIAAAIEAGDLDRARRLANGDVALPEIKTATGPIGETTHIRGQWKAEILDPKALLEDIVAGKAPIEEAVEIKLSYFNRLARRMKAENLGLRGVRGVYEETLVAR